MNANTLNIFIQCSDYTMLPNINKLETMAKEKEFLIK